MGKFAWDRGLDFEVESRRLIKIIKDRKGGVRNATRRAYATVLFIQLRNGLRIREAVEAAVKWARTRERKFLVVAGKSRHPEPPP